jgi:hypothetical protein
MIRILFFSLLNLSLILTKRTARLKRDEKFRQNELPRETNETHHSNDVKKKLKTVQKSQINSVYGSEERIFKKPKHVNIKPKITEQSSIDSFARKTKKSISTQDNNFNNNISIKQELFLMEIDNTNHNSQHPVTNTTINKPFVKNTGL